MNSLLIRSHEASAAIAPFRIAVFSDATNSRKVAQAATAVGPFAGTTGKLGAAAGEMADLTKVGIGSVQLGGTVKAGEPLTSDASGKAIVAAAGNRIIGHAEEPGTADAIIDYLCAPGVL